MARKCRCGNEIPEHKGSGRPRTKCPECSPSRNRPRVAALSSLPPGPEHPIVARTRADLGELAGTADGLILLQLAEAIAAGGGTASGLVRLSERYAVLKAAVLADAQPEADVITGLFG